MNKKLFWIAALLLAWFGRDGARGQQKTPVSSLQEDCGVTFSFNTASSGAQAAGTVTAGSTGTTPVIDNRQAGCLDWIVTYEPTSAVATVSLAFQTALDVAGVPTTWSNYPGTLTSGINPNTAVTTGGAVTEATGTAYPFLRMNMTVITGGGTIRGKLYGWKHKPTNVTVVSGSTCPGATPCVVVGNKSNNAAAPGATNVGALICLANAAAPTWTEAFEVLCSVDLAGNQRIMPAANSTALADGLSNTVNLPSAGGAASTQRNTPYQFNGSTWDKEFVCTQKAAIAATASGSTQIIAASGSTVIRICHIDWLTTAAVNVKLVSGTGANCVTGPADLTGLYTGAGAFAVAMDYAPTSALRAAASQAVCINQSGAVTTGGTVIYAQF